MCLLSFSPAVFSVAPGVFVHTTNEQLQRRQEQHSRDQGRSMSPLADTGSSGLLVIGADGIVTANVRSFGAKGDGRTDDILAIEAALASLNGTGGIVLLPSPGQYAVSRPLIVPGYSVTIRGRWNSVFIQSSPSCPTCPFNTSVHTARL